MAQLMSIKKNVDVQPGVGVPAIFHCSQGDKGTRIILGLLNNNDSYTIPEGTTAIIRGSRADGTLFTEITADIDTTTEIKFNLTEDMTSVAGPVECEAVMTSGTANIIGTANFIIDVEKSPASIGSVFPGTDAATTWLIDKLENEPLNSLNGESVVDAINGGSGSGLTEDVKTALLACFEKVAWIDENGQDYYDALYSALYPPADLVSISAVYTQSGTVYDTDTLDSLKSNLVVTAFMDDSTTRTVTTYTLSGSLSEGTSTITVRYGGKTATFTVNVTSLMQTITVTWSGAGTSKDSTVIDARNSDVYWTFPFVNGYSGYKSGVTEDTDFIGVKAKLYTDEECTTKVGEWYIDTQTIESSVRTDINCPSMPTNTQLKVAPAGYYVTLYATKRSSGGFSSNSTCGAFLNEYAADVKLMAVGGGSE